jgi:hypothetical protein
MNGEYKKTLLNASVGVILCFVWNLGKPAHPALDSVHSLWDVFQAYAGDIGDIMTANIKALAFIPRLKVVGFMLFIFVMDSLHAKNAMETHEV